MLEIATKINYFCLPIIWTLSSVGMLFSGFPNVVGAVDGTHVKIQAPTKDEDDYVNRKGYHSINVQVCYTGTQLLFSL